ncbi:MAG: pyruvate formate lyase-activating protein [Clostridiaceae bacterium BRH_c20a]|nr:MAG: pyruvate formate lyase-activating protein [Clostridiaceae bacterium BRH_c20a]
MSNFINNKSALGCVFNIQKFCIHDGPGIRDVVFVKGCPLSCRWCCNPESQNIFIELAYKEGKCIGVGECGRCLEICSADAIKISENEKQTIEIDRRLCLNCGNCAKVCPSAALNLMGKFISVREVVDSVCESNIFYRRSGGGITVSGGEPLLQAEFTYDLLKECHRLGISTAIETSGYALWGDVERVCKYVDLIFYDIKSLNSNKHSAFTGVPNELILENLLRISKSFPEIPIIVRTPVIPGFNHTEDDIRSIVEFISSINSLKQYELLNYHNFGEAKYRQLGREYLMAGIKPLDKEYFEELQNRYSIPG